MIDAQAKRLAEMQNNEEARVEGEVKKKEALEGFIFLNISIFFSLWSFQLIMILFNTHGRITWG